MKILITGIAGFIGFHLAKELIARDNSVIGIDNFNDYYDPQLKFDRLSLLGITKNDIDVVTENAKLTVLKGDIVDRDLWSQLEKYKIDLIIHLAAQAGVRYSIENPMAYIQSNIVGFQNVIDFSVKMGHTKLLYASSSSVYGSNSKQPFEEIDACNQPESLYAATKRSNELIAYSYSKTKGLNSIGLRFFTVYGPWGRPDMAPMLFAKAAVRNERISVYNNGKQKRDFTFIDDIIAGIIGCINFNVRGSEVLNIGRGMSTNLMDFISEIESNFNVKLEKDFTPPQTGDVVETFANTAKLESMISYKPSTDLKVGIKIFAEWYKDYYRTSNSI
jgi:UDP-glucuronate 4-epimerase